MDATQQRVETGGSLSWGHLVGVLKNTRRAPTETLAGSITIILGMTRTSGSSFHRSTRASYLVT